MNILITGNSGYVGSLLVPYLKKKYPKYHLYGFDTGYFFQDFLKYDKLPESYLENQVFSDIRNRNINLPKKIDTVIHLASLSNDPLGNINKNGPLYGWPAS